MSQQARPKTPTEADMVSICWQLKRATVLRLEEAKWVLRMPKQRIAEEAITEYLNRRLGGAPCESKTSD